ncbi:bifunctional adenosylcobinamide kinase/adenosylcobinamide-phosphate guanylyltransferase [Pacificibacter marinus]|uniref:bifunctional adenosylcobinamide kinase/adenosylcobinamide-phosphate guanylyltransferase n=1 Tax=Pacificibacter marinus TaxID=658057 RepID=UPI001C079E3C|nr:bifunctional adenosylcobinamide kinase/adenosylcobinamide-phosphate guanylyltransferase [Pacificibacter marinus]MBU2868801.1 bifunctional adenosylcobinamide kinase/adenosylcobinamide-phosphate guanylyltransferase [Pacificibacter marinus]
MCADITLILGGASSGKSHLAEKICFSSPLPRIYIATAQAFDDEMRDKITQHQLDRGETWTTFEAPFKVDSVLRDIPSGQIVLLDCATLWLTNHLLAEHDIAQQTEALLGALSTCASPVVIVSNEVGQGIVPENKLARRFRIEQGRLNRRLAEHASSVVGVMAGLPFVLKGDMPKALTQEAST